MNAVLIIFLSLSLSGSILALILLAIKPFVKKRLSQTWQYYIWLVVIFRFLLPFTPEVTLIGGLTAHFQNMQVLTAEMDEKKHVEENGTNIAGQSADPLQVTKHVLQNTGTETSAKTTYWKDIVNNLWVIWLTVALILLVHKVMSYRSFTRFVWSGTNKEADQALLDIYKEELEAAKIRRNLPLYIHTQIASPMLIGLVRPAIVLPVLDIRNDGLRQIIRHELTHYRRSDAVYKWLIQIMVCIHWFNPLVYRIRKEINRCCELSCDENVIHNLDFDSRIVYGDALIASLNTHGKRGNCDVSLPMGDNANLIKERLDMLMNYKNKSRLSVCAAFLLSILFLCSFTFMGAYASSPNSSHPGSNFLSETQKVKNIKLHIDNANVMVKFAENDQFLYDYDKAKHRITYKIIDSNMEIKVENLKAPHGASVPEALADMIIIYIPDRSYNNVTVDETYSGVSLPELNAKLHLTSNNGSMSIQIPEDFNKVIDLAHTNGSGLLNIDAKAKNYAVNLTSKDSSVSTSPGLPVFINGRPWEYKNGNGAAKINIDLSKSSFTISKKEK
ncbi:M56 family metallopeptidase [Paenibacillus jilunlii]|uniref:Signal transducer regulating beta-lactamase production, contains metallopeptidase domain n=1 Tax=Paenibacillus jilunlii TaxID=682956 RepID=A0A1G9KPE3_9BACL|nr:M56 family metallopeptidase [Paenibacillus jilunlii]SDL51466.1 Signal transducer regulating beta-lactamase production, contains metallopeptidase domain [Paenibacillus jilunlii]